MRHPGVRSPEMLLAPPADGSSGVLKFPGRDRFPRLDEHVVRPETREEMVRGERVYAQPALAPHGDRHFRLDYVVGAHVRAGWVGSTDLLTHVLHGSDFASDTCIRREGEDPATGERYLEELAFEVVYAQPLKKVTERAEDWTRRGVRRVLGIFVKNGTVEEFVPGSRTWRAFESGGAIHDSCLVRPLGVRELLDAALGDDAVARALEAKDNPVIVAMKAASEERGEERGARREAAEAVLAVLAGRGIAVSERVRAEVLGLVDLARLRRWLLRAVTAGSAEEVVDAP